MAAKDSYKFRYTHIPRFGWKGHEDREIWRRNQRRRFVQKHCSDQPRWWAGAGPHLRLVSLPSHHSQTNIIPSLFSLSLSLLSKIKKLIEKIYLKVFATLCQEYGVSLFGRCSVISQIRSLWQRTGAGLYFCPLFIGFCAWVVFEFDSVSAAKMSRKKKIEFEYF